MVQVERQDLRAGHVEQHRQEEIWERSLQSLRVEQAYSNCRNSSSKNETRSTISAAVLRTKHGRGCFHGPLPLLHATFIKIQNAHDEFPASTCLATFLYQSKLFLLQFVAGEVPL